MTAVRPARAPITTCFQRRLASQRRWWPAFMLGLCTTLAQAQAGDGAPDTRSCATLWQVTHLPGGDAGEPAQLRVALRFQGGPRNQTALHLPGGWDALAETDTPRLRPVAGEPAWRSVAHAPGDTVQLQWRLQPGAALLAPGWFAFGGQRALPLPEGADASPACVLMDGLPADSRWASSHGSTEGPWALWRLGSAGVPLAQRVQQSLYAGGALQAQAAPGVLAVLPRPSPWAIDAGTLAAVGAQALAAQQRPWQSAGGASAASHAGQDGGGAAPWLLLALPAPAAPPAAPEQKPADAALAAAWHQALGLLLPPGWAGDGAEVQRLLAPAVARAWLADRFGPLAHTGRGDGALRAWFSEGWADFLAHRALLRDGLWTPEDFAAAMNARAAVYLADPARALPNADLAAASPQSPLLAQMQALRGEWLAFTWHQALRRAGRPGLDAALRLQLVSPDKARREGPLSQPLATHRLLATLRGVLKDQPLRDLQQFIDQGRPFVLGPDSLGPCFTAAPVAPGSAPVWRPVPGALQQASCQGWLGMGPPEEMALAPVPRLAPVAGVSGGPGDCDMVTVQTKRSKAGKAGKATRAGTRQVLRCRASDAAPGGNPPTAKAGGKAGAKAAAKSGGKTSGKSSAKAAPKVAAKAAAKSAGKSTKPQADKKKR
jgi:hypothetical protein